MSFLGVEGDGADEILLVAIRTLKVVTKESMELRDAFIAQDRCCKLLEAYESNSEITAHLLSLIKVCCKNVENNKGYFMKAGGCKRVLAAMTVHSGNPAVLGEACFVVNTLCKFDDFRKEMSSAHENAKEVSLCRRSGLLAPCIHQTQLTSIANLRSTSRLQPYSLISRA